MKTLIRRRVQKWDTRHERIKRAASWQNRQSECAPSEDSHQPGHPPSLIRVFAVRMKKPWAQSDQSHEETLSPIWSEPSLCAQRVAKDPSFLHADSGDPDQTGRMPRLIWVFAGRTLTLLVLSCRGSSSFYFIVLYFVSVATVTTNFFQTSIHWLPCSNANIVLIFENWLS